MPLLNHEVTGAEPVDPHGNCTGPPVTIPPGTEYSVTVPKLKRPSDSFDEYWSEIRVGNQLYRIPLKLLEDAA
jgi:hypothetical protein